MRITKAEKHEDSTLNNNATFGDGSSLVRSEIVISDKNASFILGNNSKLRDTKVTLGTNASIEIGNNCTFDGEIFIGAYSSLKIGDNISITHSLNIKATEQSSVEIGADCLFASSVTIRTTDGHPIYNAYTRERINPPVDIIIGDHVWVGDAVRIFKGVIIGNASIVGAGSIVTKNIENNTLVAGVPAKVLKTGITWEHSPNITTNKFYLSSTSTDHNSPVMNERKKTSGIPLVSDEIEPINTVNESVDTTSDNTEHVNQEETEYIVRGVRMSIPNAFLTPAIEKAIKSERYEGLEARQLPRFLKDGDRLLELGAGLGFISSFAHSLVKLNSCVVVEANPLLIPVIEKTHSLNRVDAKVVNGIALSDESDLHKSVKENGKIPFYVTKNFWEASLTAVKEAVSVEQVPVLRINDLIEEHKPSVFICDIEGGEIDLLEGVDLSCIKHAFFEVHKNIIGPQGIYRLAQTLANQGLYYDPDYSMGAAVMYSRN